MIEQPEPEGGRAADAFRAALARHADEVVPGRSLPTRPARRRGRWLAAGAAVAVAASAVVGFALVDRDRPGDGALDPAGEPPAIAEGWRGVTFRDVTVQVPEDWGDGNVPQTDWCTAGLRPPLDGPYVDTRLGVGAILDIGCPPVPDVPPGFQPGPVSTWLPHLEMYDTTYLEDPLPDGTTTHAGWTLRVRTLGDVQLRLLSESSTEAVAEEIMAGAQQSDTGVMGCDTTSPAQEAPQPEDPVFPPDGDLASVDEEAVWGLLVCQYDRVGPNRPALRAERRLEASKARDWLAAAQAAPRTGGPDAPQNCLEPWESLSSLAVFPLAEDGSRLATAYVTYDACVGNGLRDAMTTYQLTEGDCAPLFGGRVVFGGGQSAVYRVCTAAEF
jgi:hypothetical protein